VKFSKHFFILYGLLPLLILSPPPVVAGITDGIEKAEDGLAFVDDHLFLASPNGWFRSDLSGLLDLETYYVDQRGPGLIFGDESFFGPRLSLFLDTHMGEHLYSLLQARFDRGFDPRSQKQDARLDEYLLRYKPFKTGWVHFQIGKFATVVGNWVRRHDSWQNPFINAPVPYENVTIASDLSPPRDPQDFLLRRLSADRKALWLPVIWGPAYTTGASVFGTLERFDYAFEVKNNSISSRPPFWTARQVRWRDPTVSGRLGYRPSPAWNLGTSFSLGTYLNEKARPSLPPGKDLDDYYQIMVGPDIEFAWRRWQVWSEAFWSRFEVPNAGNADTLTYYVETRYKMTPRTFLAGRWNQQFFSQIDDGAGGHKRWDRDLFRVDLSLVFRLSRHMQTKFQYSYSHQKGELQQGENLFANQVTFKF